MIIKDPIPKKYKVLLQRFTLAVLEGVVTKDSFDFDQRVKFVMGVQMTSNFADKLYFRGKTKIEIGGLEVVPFDTEAKILLSNQSVKPDDRYTDLGELDPKNRVVKVEYTDTAHASAAYAAYNAVYIFKTLIEA